MSAGFRNMVINTQERAVSTDINRLQRFKEQDLAETFRMMLDVFAQTEDDQLGVVTAPNTIETPLRSEIVGNGFLVRPQQASLNLLVDSGVLFAMAPDSALDESNYKYIRDDGVTTPGSLVVTANASGSTRIDLVEASIDPTPLIVTDNRDLFNPSTGLFNASTITKETRGRLRYRVTAGTPGSGIPVRTAGWLPLAVISVPNGSTSVDTMTFWDVRPLIGDRVDGVIAKPRVYSRARELSWVIDDITDGAKRLLSGFAHGWHAGRSIGGRLRRGTPGTDATTVDLLDAAHLANGYSLVNGLVYFYLCFPAGLPRWARYTDGPSGRVPRSPKGILVVTDTMPLHMGQQPSAAIAMPASTGLSVSTTDGVCIGVVRYSTSLRVAIASEHGIFSKFNSFTPTVPTAAVNDATGQSYTLVEGTHYPAGAREIFVHVTCTIDVPDGCALNVADQSFNAGIPAATAGNGEETVSVHAPTDFTNTSGFTQSFIVRSQGWIAVPPQHNAGGSPGSWVFRWARSLTAVYGTAPTNITAEGFVVRGVRF